MEQLNWLVVIAMLGSVFALVCVWLLNQLTRLKVLVPYLRKEAEDKAQLAELLALAQKKIASLEAQNDMMGNAQTAMKTEFQNTANALFENISQKFSQQSEKKIGDILLPLSQRIGEFQKNVDEKFGTAGKETHTLKAEIARIVAMNEQMRTQTESLTKALRGDVKAQGNWGEVMLERILEESGLVKNVDYIVQAEEMGLKGEAGNHLKPDVIVKLPDDKHVIIDAKVSLTAYERYCRENDELQVREFVRSIKNHIIGLEQKRYQDIEKLASPDFVFMFLPVEGAFSLALQHDPELHAFAWGKKIALVCPSTLFASLMTIASLWRIERQNKNTLEIARQAGALYDKFVGFVDDLKDIGDKITRTQTAYEGALGKLSSGSGNLVGRAEKIKSLGAKTTKSLPKELLLEPIEESETL